MVESAPAVAYGAPDMTHFLPPPAALAVTYMGEAASVAPAPAVTYGAPPFVTSSGPYAVTYPLQPQVAPAVTYLGAAPIAPAPFFFFRTRQGRKFTCRDLHEGSGKSCKSTCCHVLLICSVECPLSWKGLPQHLQSRVIHDSLARDLTSARNVRNVVCSFCVRRIWEAASLSFPDVCRLHSQRTAKFERSGADMDASSNEDDFA